MSRVVRQTTVIRDGMHNAFPSMAYWKGQYWVTYRKATAHWYRPDSRVTIANSVDRYRFSEIASLKVDGDCRGPWLQVVDDQLILGWPTGVKQGDGTVSHQMWRSCSSDGVNWSKPVPFLDVRHDLFRTRKVGETWYGLSIYREEKIKRLYLMRSSDHLEWELVSQVGVDDELLNEADLHVTADGEMWVIARSLLEPDPVFFCMAKPPYTEWTTHNLGFRLHCPVLFEHGGHVYVVGREARHESDPTWPFGNSLAIWTVQRESLEVAMRLPSIGDGAYADVCHDRAGRLCLVYYSQHAYYLGVHEPFGGQLLTEPGDSYANDIYFAERELG